MLEIFESNVDITERKNAERLAAIGATAGMVGHDIRNPLQTIAGEVFLGTGRVERLARRRIQEQASRKASTS